LSIQLAEEINDDQVDTKKNDWTSFDLYVAIDAEPSTIMNAWSTIRGMESFFVQMMRIKGPVSQLISIRLALGSNSDRDCIIQTGKADSSGIQSSVVEQLSGEAPDEVLLRVDEETFDEVAICSRYILALTNLFLIYRS